MEPSDPPRLDHVIPLKDFMNLMAKSSDHIRPLFSEMYTAVRVIEDLEGEFVQHLNALGEESTQGRRQCRHCNCLEDTLLKVKG